jgi:hypothetical protein
MIQVMARRLLQQLVRENQRLRRRGNLVRNISRSLAALGAFVFVLALAWTAEWPALTIAGLPFVAALMIALYGGLLNRRARLNEARIEQILAEASRDRDRARGLVRQHGSPHMTRVEFRRLPWRRSPEPFREDGRAQEEDRRDRRRERDEHGDHHGTS